MSLTVNILIRSRSIVGTELASGEYSNERDFISHMEG